MRRIFLVLGLASLALLLNNQLVKAQETTSSIEAASEVSQPVDVGNQICPVSGEKIKPETKATYEYKGKIYNLCCPMCIEEFKKDPEKYIKKVEEELKAKSGKVSEESEMPSQMHHH
ncbi:MAG: YHS domain-containing protein [Candidatus Omnitrophota bacterium]